jgi:hypothetical protein
MASNPNRTSRPSARGHFYTRLHPERAINRALDQLRSLGYQVTLEHAG